MGALNRHHNIPRSYGGSNDSCNVPYIDASEHAAFHAVFGHLTPDQLLRMLVVSSAYKGPPKSFLTDFLNAATERDWRGMYDPAALRMRPNGNGAHDGESATYALAAGFVERAQVLIGELNGVFKQTETARLKQMDEEPRYRVHQGMQELERIVNDYRALLRPPHTAPTAEGVSNTRIALHTAFQLLAETRATMSSVQALLGQRLSDDARALKNDTLRFFRSETGADAAKAALNKTNGAGILLYANPLLPRKRTQFLSALRTVQYENPDDTERVGLITVLNAHTRRLLGSLLSEQQIIDQGTAESSRH